VSGERLTITQETLPQQWPRIGGNFIVWEAQQADGQRDIYAYDLTTRQVFPAVTGPHDQARALIEDEYISWIDVNDKVIYYRHIEGGPVYTVYQFGEDERLNAAERDGIDFVWPTSPVSEYPSGPYRILVAQGLDRQTYFPIIYR